MAGFPARCQKSKASEALFSEAEQAEQSEPFGVTRTLPTLSTPGEKCFELRRRLVHGPAARSRKRPKLSSPKQRKWISRNLSALHELYPRFQLLGGSALNSKGDWYGDRLYSRGARLKRPLPCNVEAPGLISSRTFVARIPITGFVNSLRLGGWRRRRLCCLCSQQIQLRKNRRSSNRLFSFSNTELESIAYFLTIGTQISITESSKPYLKR
jgi:hypothetical protein